ncbi:carbohydrate kinase family protein [Kineosporia sp. J2-2]|uniref:Carbohydrate kinase family protein n=1 Tax=Kineosporia corallincola TaxID=2835133 RepID=A0ABS5TSX9_9ACTN|nr:carbohydrate kinase family protein [Kineosporia corallincola]MBT0773895.1 carbohydrate kinase family protein [Kineosporia corallincola]
MLCAGGAVVDLKIRFTAPAVAGTSNPGTGSASLGGVARNVAENLAALGVPVSLLSAVGDDAPGQALILAAQRCGIATDHVAVLPGEVTAQYVALLEPDGGLSVGAAAMAVLDRITTGHLQAAWPGQGWVFCDGNLSPPVLALALDQGRREARPVAFDAVSTHKVLRLPRDLSGLSLLSCNRAEARAWLGRHGLPTDGDDKTLATALRAAGAGAVLLTRGPAGLVVASEGVLAEVPAVPASPIDVTGAGDALMAGTLAALIGGADLVTAARAGAERAARTVESELSVLPAS